MANASSRESTIEGAVVKWCKRHDVLTTKIGGAGQRGKSDRIFWVPGGKPVLIEFKRPGEEPTKLQWHRIETLQGLGYSVYWTDNAEAAIGILEGFL